MKKKYKKNAMTLIEVILAAAIFGIAAFGLYVMSFNARLISRKNLIRELAIGAAESRLSQILGMPYEDRELFLNTESLSDQQKIDEFYNQHNPTIYTFNGADSGIYKVFGDKSDFILLSEGEVGWFQRYSDNNNRYDPNTRPFPIVAIPDSQPAFDKPYSPLTNYLGKEINDLRYHVSGGNITVYALEGDLKHSTIDNSTVDPVSFAIQKQYGYIYADDVDDFDGMNYKIYNVYKDISFNVEVAVRPHYRLVQTRLGYRDSSGLERTDVLADNMAPEFDLRIPLAIEPNTTPYPKAPVNIKSYWDMGEISLNAVNNLFGGGLNLAAQRKMALDYYRDCIYKEIVVTISWRFPENAPLQSFTLTGIVSADDETILSKSVNMDNIFDVD